MSETFENRINSLSAFDVALPDSDDFIARLHTRREQRQERARRIRSGVSAAVLVLAVGLLGRFQINSTLNRLEYLEANYLTLEEQTTTTEYIADATLYLLAQSDDLWSTLEFFDEIEFNPVTLSME